MAAGDFTAFGVVNRPENWSYNNQIGNLNVSAMADANRGALIGDVNYNTPVGTVSNPVRTRFGYHLIKVNDIRANRGEVAVAHIMILRACLKNVTNGLGLSTSHA